METHQMIENVKETERIRVDKELVKSIADSLAIEMAKKDV